MREVNHDTHDGIEKLFVKVFTADNSAKSLLADDRMSVSVICRQLAEKNHIVMDPKCCIVEHLPELYLERFYEDNESLVENVLLWTRDSSNRLYFMEKEEKYDLFVNPERYLLGSHSSERDHQLDDESKSNLIDEFFTGGHPVPEVEGCLYLKSDGKKAWKKHFFVLRASGLYYSLKGKSKSSKDLVCLTTFEMNNVYYGFGWRKKYKAPNDFGFAIKHPQIQAKNSKYIKYLCADNDFELKLWTTGIRVAKYGRQLKDNYDNITREIVEADLDSLADRRSFSVCSMAKTAQGSPSSPVNSCASVSDSLPASEGYPASEGCSTSEGSAASDGSPAREDVHKRAVRPTSITITSNYGNNWHQMSRHDSIRSSSTSSSSGFLSERDSTVSTPTKEQLAFEVDFPVGTIKRKPSAMQPKIPLTNTTRNLALQSDDALVEMDSSDSDDDEAGTQQHYGTLKSGTLRRSATDDRLNNRIYEPLREHRFQNMNNTNNTTTKTTVQSMCSGESVVDELPLPPPPATLQTSLSTLSLNSLPPPPSEVLDSPDFGSDSATPTPMSPVVSPKKSPQSPQVPPKPKLLRRMSETANDRNNFVNELKSRSNTLQRGLNSRSKLSMDLNNSAISAYATSPRMKTGPYVQAMNGGLSPMNSTYSVNGSTCSGGSLPTTPVNDVRIGSPIHQRSPVRYQPSFPGMSVTNQMQSHPTISANPGAVPPPPQHCYEPLPVPQQSIYQSYGPSSRQLSADHNQLYGNTVNQNQNHLNINGNHFNQIAINPIKQYNCNNNNNFNYNNSNNNNNLMNNLGQQTGQSCYGYPQSQQIYGQQPLLSKQSFPQQPQHYPQQRQQHCYQQFVEQQHFQQQNHYQQHQQQRPQQIPVPQMQVYGGQQPIYGPCAVQSQQQLVNSQTYTKSKIYSVPPNDPSRSPMKGPLPPPPEAFLKEIQRVMDKKWKVAQTLSSDMSATPNQILGFRDPVYLPPKTDQNYGTNLYDVLPTRPMVKSVRISDQVHEIPMLKQNHRRVPPPLPKRSENTHLSQRQVL